LNVFHSVDERYPFALDVDAGILIEGVSPQLDTVGLVPVSDVTAVDELAGV